MQKIVLYEYQSTDISVTIEALINEQGSLVISGYDIGEAVSKICGDSDYEYSMTIPAAELAKLRDLVALGDDNSRFLDWLYAHFHSNNCFSAIQQFLKSSNIAFESFSWT